ncbi:unnamed protein product [Ambrosiozyma monospora]|uniref:Unnamed protein product n=1 Tax=Ambrosiozyma monospora TaxID=43982 RepID=A0ACB5UB18_AMBMO|nr:unnamed protein product [Ambrosiozyma monospora]
MVLKLNSESDPSKINKDFLKNFDDLTKNEVFGSQMANAMEISNLLTLNDEMPPAFFKKYEEKVNQSHPRQFENGVLIPEKDDVMWSLQILAFISKYTSLRRQLSETYIINGLSLRTFNTNPPPLEMDNNEDNDYIEDDLNEYLVPEPAVTSKFGYQDGTEDDLMDEQNSQADYRSILAN